MSVEYYGQYMTATTEAEILALVGKEGDVAYAKDTKIRYMYNGGSWFPTDGLRVLRSTVSVNGLSAATTKILTIPPTSFRFVPLAAHIEVLTLTGTVVTPPTISVGTNSTAYNNMFTTSALSSLLSTGSVQPNALTIGSSLNPLAGSTDVYAKVNAAALGPSVETLQIDLMGYFKV